MKVLVVGSGAREHALAQSVARSAGVAEVLVAPGNGGTGREFRNVPLDPMDVEAAVAVAREHEPDLIVIGPDDPLGAGIVDALQEARFRTFGPRKAAAQIEGSKAWAKGFMGRHGIPTAAYRTFDSASGAHRFIIDRPRDWERVVVKADGYARGKGVIVCDDDDEAHAAVDSIMEERIFGTAGDTVVIERRIAGPEASVFALCDGETALPMGTACDHKRIFDGDKGPNTGGMGAYTPTSLVPPDVLEDVMRRIIRPAVQGLAAEGRPFTGFLFAGLMFTGDGPQVIEFNARFGDPEAEALLPLLESDLVECIEAALDGRLVGTTLRWRPEAACAVCLASGGYPDDVRDGFPIAGLDQVDPDSLVFHAGTVEREGEIVSKGGRVLTVVGRGPTLAAARDHAYANVKKISFPGMQYRRDIGAKEAAPERAGTTPL